MRADPPDGDVRMDRFDIAVIGAGPAGEAAAHKARALGASVASSAQEGRGSRSHAFTVSVCVTD